MKSILWAVPFAIVAATSCQHLKTEPHYNSEAAMSKAYEGMRNEFGNKPIQVLSILTFYNDKSGAITSFTVADKSNSAEIVKYNYSDGMWTGPEAVQVMNNGTETKDYLFDLGTIPPATIVKVAQAATKACEAYGNVVIENIDIRKEDPLQKNITQQVHIKVYLKTDSGSKTYTTDASGAFLQLQ